MEFVEKGQRSVSRSNCVTCHMAKLKYQKKFVLCRVFRARELLGQAWMKADKTQRAAHVLLVSKRFNEVCTSLCAPLYTALCTLACILFVLLHVLCMPLRVLNQRKI